VAVTETSLDLEGADLSPEAWERLLARLVRVRASSPWWIGDAIAFGERTWGRMYAPAAKATGLAPGTLRNYAYVSRRVAPADRHAGLAWNFHYRVAPLSPEGQRRWLGRARQFRWTAPELAAELRAAELAKRDGGQAFPKPQMETEHECPKCHYRFPCEAVRA
jgi:hypothetical protein